MDRQSEVTSLVSKLSEMRGRKTELDAVIRRYVPKDGDALVPKPIDPVLERLMKMTAEELLPFVLPGISRRKQITQSLREGHVWECDLEGLVLGVVRGNLLPDEVSARAASLAEWTKVNDAEIAAVRSRYQVILDKFAEVEQQIKETETQYESLTNLYEVKVSGTETRTQTRDVSGTIQVRALSVEEAIETAIEKSDEVDWNEEGYYEDGDSECEINEEVDESDVEVIEDNVGSAKGPGA
jgi:phage shock protein A